MFLFFIFILYSTSVIFFLIKQSQPININSGLDLSSSTQLLNNYAVT